MKSVRASLGERQYHLLALSDGHTSHVEDFGKV
jgi:hypothetical protein